MENNVGRLDRLFRFSVGFLCLAIAFIASDMILKILFGLVSVVLIGTAVIGFCPLNKLVGLDTTQKKPPPG